MTPAAEATEAGALFTTYHDRICRYITGMVHDPAEAEDLTQETFLRAFRHRDSLRDPGAARGWLYRIATHACLDRLPQRPASMPIDDSAPSKAPSALETAERADTSLCVQRCLDFLPDSYRAVILLYEAHGLTAAEIAELLGVSLATVKIRLHRARRKLEQIMQIG
jgi:RNA polymerase sigma-70 factor (ECF subfamily)